jgi:uncharacterized membrane protein YfcA
MPSLWLALSAFATAVLSGVFGMAGGLLLMGVYALLLPVASAMVLHGATQLCANGMRALLLRRHIHWRGLGWYLLGAALASAVLFQLRYLPDRALVFLGLGLSPFVAAALPARWFDFQRPLAAVICGVQVTALHLAVGVAGPLLDVSFIDTRLSKNQIVATKAITQVFAHTIKLVYFVGLVSARELRPTLVLATIVATILGTRVGTRILERLSDQDFRRWSRTIVYAIGCVYLSRACLALLQRWPHR